MFIPGRDLGYLWLNEVTYDSEVRDYIIDLCDRYLPDLPSQSYDCFKDNVLPFVLSFENPSEEIAYVSGWKMQSKIFGPLGQLIQLVDDNVTIYSSDTYNQHMMETFLKGKPDHGYHFLLFEKSTKTKRIHGKKKFKQLNPINTFGEKEIIFKALSLLQQIMVIAMEFTKVFSE